LSERVFMQFTIPCACGRQVTVDPTLAGRTVICPCGGRVQVPSVRELERRGIPILPASARGRLTVAGWIFLLLAVAALGVGGMAALALDLERGVERKFMAVLFGGGLLLLVGVVAAVARVLGVRFFHD
jgi:hypothetical protein